MQVVHELDWNFVELQVSITWLYQEHESLMGVIAQLGQNTLLISNDELEASFKANIYTNIIHPGNSCELCWRIFGKLLEPH
jgi:glucan phosphoethanolaminetransferase (alkaline phosphatase superfamily)